MGPEEIDIALDELETRLDRLRSLYEQYFLGIEKIEPGVARKDVDRRFWLLRRVQIRNTARRFRLQTLIQRYNTFQQHWARICREIENGTYTRHLLRAKKLGEEPKTWAAKKRLGYFRRRGVTDDGEANDAPSELGEMLDSGADLAVEGAVAAQAALELAEARAREAPRAPAARRTELEALDLDLDDDLGAPAQPAPRPIARPPGPKPSPPKPAPPVRPAPPAAPKLPLASAAKPPAEARAPAPAAVVAAKPPLVRPASPAEPAAPAPRAPTPKQPAAPVSPEAVITEARLRQIHGELSAAKRQLNQADAVSLDALSKSLRDSEKRIRAQHPGRAVDFHVVVKDGKAVVKPIVRK